MSIFDFQSAVGQVHLLCIGEWSVQSFRAIVSAGQKVRRMDEIGHFDLGSQIILALPKGLRILPEEGAKMFVGDPLAALEKSVLTFLKLLKLHCGESSSCSTMTVVEDMYMIFCLSVQRAETSLQVKRHQTRSAEQKL